MWCLAKSFIHLFIFPYFLKLTFWALFAFLGPHFSTLLQEHKGPQNQLDDSQVALIHPLFLFLNICGCLHLFSYLFLISEGKKRYLHYCLNCEIWALQPKYSLLFRNLASRAPSLIICTLSLQVPFLRRHRGLLYVGELSFISLCSPF